MGRKIASEVVSEGSGNSFEDVAAKVTEVELPPETASAAIAEPEPEKFIVPEDATVWTVQAIFWPLKRYSHPAWEVTEEEAALVSPKLQPFLQRFFDEFIPQWMGKYVSENKELGELVIAFSALLFIKSNQVKRMKRIDALIAEAKRKEEEAKNPPIDISAVAPAPTGYEFNVPKKVEEVPD